MVNLIKKIIRHLNNKNKCYNINKKTFNNLFEQLLNNHKLINKLEQENKKLKNENKELKKKQVFVFRAPTSP